MRSIDVAHSEGLRRDLPPFRTGDTIRVHVRIREGEKERIQVFEGVVIRRKRGGPAATFTVRKISYGVGVERVFPVESPSVTKVEIKRRGHVRRSRIYYLRELTGKKARLRSKVRDLTGLVSDQEADERDGVAVAEPNPELETSAETEATEEVEVADPDAEETAPDEAVSEEAAPDEAVSEEAAPDEAEAPDEKSE